LKAQALVDEARPAGIKFALADGQVRLAASAPPPPELLARLRGHKAEIAALPRKGSPEPDETELEKRKGMAIDGVPEPYLDAWARLQVQKPVRVSDAEWRQAIDDAGRFLAQWGSLALKFAWEAGELFRPMSTT
jgi:hypothetical protein